MTVSSSPLQRDAPGAVATEAGPRRRFRARRHAPALLLLIPFVVVLACFWPGHMSNDSLDAFRQARDEVLSNQHSPILNALWGVAWDVFNAGPGWILALQVSTFLLGAYLLLTGVVRPLPAALLTCALAAWPAVFGMLGYISRDVWFTAGVVLTFGLVSVAGRSEGRARWLVLAAALVVAFFTNATRQNAAPAIWPACILVAALVLPAWRSRRARPPATRRRAVAGAAVLGSVLTLALIGLQFAILAPMEVGDNAPQQQLFAYDLAGLSEQDRENLFPPSIVADQTMAPIDARWNVDSVVPFVFPPTGLMTVPLDPERAADIEQAWREAIVDDPLGYAELRTELWLRQISVTRRSTFIYHPAIDPNSFGFKIRFDGLNSAAKDYVEAWAVKPTLDGGVIHAVWIYLLICVVATFALIRRSRSWAVLVLGAAAFGSIAYQSGLFFGAMGTQYRWQLSVVVCGLLALVAGVVVLRGGGRATTRSSAC
jgi:hypothetical protein